MTKKQITEILERENAAEIVKFLDNYDINSKNILFIYEDKNEYIVELQGQSQYYFENENNIFDTLIDSYNHNFIHHYNTTIINYHIFNNYCLKLKLKFDKN